MINNSDVMEQYFEAMLFRVGKKPAFFEKNRAGGFFWFLLAFFKKSRLLLLSFPQGFYSYIFDYLIQ